MTIESFSTINESSKCIEIKKTSKMDQVTETGVNINDTKGSRIFQGHRALGYVSNHVPLQCRFVHRRRENLIVTCVGRSFHTYGGNKLGLLSVSKLHPDNITALAADSFMVYTSACSTIYAWRRGSELGSAEWGGEGCLKIDSERV